METRNKVQLIIILFFVGLLIFVIAFINPTRDVPVVKADIIFDEKDGIVQAQEYTFHQGTIEYIKRPRSNIANSFPAITARVMIAKGINTIIGPWETLKYNGSGKYSFNIGFDERNLPKSSDIIHVTVMVVDENGERIGYVTEEFKWK